MLLVQRLTLYTILNSPSQCANAVMALVSQKPFICISDSIKLNILDYKNSSLNLIRFIVGHPFFGKGTTFWQGAWTLKRFEKHSVGIIQLSFNSPFPKRRWSTEEEVVRTRERTNLKRLLSKHYKRRKCLKLTFDLRKCASFISYRIGKKKKGFSVWLVL